MGLGHIAASVLSEIVSRAHVMPRFENIFIITKTWLEWPREAIKCCLSIQDTKKAKKSR